MKNDVKEKKGEGRGPLSETPCVRIALYLQGGSHPITEVRETKGGTIVPFLCVRFNQIL